jgi:hypothetical protein
MDWLCGVCLYRNSFFGFLTPLEQIVPKLVKYVLLVQNKVAVVIYFRLRQTIVVFKLWLRCQQLLLRQLRFLRNCADVVLLVGLGDRCVETWTSCLLKCCRGHLSP